MTQTIVHTIVPLVPPEQGRWRLKLRHLNFHPDSSSTCIRREP